MVFSVLDVGLLFRCFVELASDGLKGRVFECSLADLQNDEVAFRKFKLVAEDVQGKNVLTNFHGMTLTTDKLRSLVKKWQVSITTGRRAEGWMSIIIILFLFIFCSFSTSRLLLKPMLM